MTDSEWMQPGEVAALFNVSVWSLYRWEKRGKLKATRMPSGQRRYARVDVAALYEETYGRPLRDSDL